MKTHLIYKNLAILNQLPAGEARAAFLDCCPSSKWADCMTEHRPFSMLDDLYTTAEAIWFSLTPADWLEVLVANSDSVSLSLSRIQQFENNDLKAQFAEAKRLYEEKFGFIFVGGENGHSLSEALAICKARLSNSARIEIQIAANEQQKIIDLKLNQLLEK